MYLDTLDTFFPQYKTSKSDRILETKLQMHFIVSLLFPSKAAIWRLVVPCFLNASGLVRADGGVLWFRCSFRHPFLSLSRHILTQSHFFPLIFRMLCKVESRSIRLGRPAVQMNFLSRTDERGCEWHAKQNSSWHLNRRQGSGVA